MSASNTTRRHHSTETAHGLAGCLASANRALTGGVRKGDREVVRKGYGTQNSKRKVVAANGGKGVGRRGRARGHGKNSGGHIVSQSAGIQEVETPTPIHSKVAQRPNKHLPDDSPLAVSLAPIRASEAVEQPTFIAPTPKPAPLAECILCGIQTHKRHYLNGCACLHAEAEYRLTEVMYRIGSRHHSGRKLDRAVKAIMKSRAAKENWLDIEMSLRLCEKCALDPLNMSCAAPCSCARLDMTIQLTGYAVCTAMST